MATLQRESTAIWLPTAHFGVVQLGHTSAETRDLSVESRTYAKTTAEQRETPIEKVIFNLPIGEVVEILKKSLSIINVFAYHSSLAEWKNLRRVAAIARLSGGEIDIKRNVSGEIIHASLRLPSQEHDFPLFKRIIDIIIAYNEKDDADFAKVIGEISKELAKTYIGESLIGVKKSSDTTSVFAHIIDYLLKVRTDELPAVDRLALRMSFLHDIAKYMFRPPFFAFDERGVLVRIDEKNYPELIELMKADRLDDHGLLAALYFKRLMDDILEWQTKEERESNKYECLNSDLERLVTRMFRLHQIAAQLDRASQSLPGLTPSDVHELFGGDIEFERHVVSLVAAMTAFDSSSVADFSDNPLHAKFEGMNPIFVYNVFYALLDVFEQKRDEIVKSLTFLHAIIAQNIDQSIQRLVAAGEQAQALLEELIDFITEQAPEFSSSITLQMQTSEAS